MQNLLLKMQISKKSAKMILKSLTVRCAWPFNDNYKIVADFEILSNRSNKSNFKKFSLGIKLLGLELIRKTSLIILFVRFEISIGKNLFGYSLNFMPPE